MKKKIFSLLILIAPVYVFAQLSIGSADRLFLNYSFNDSIQERPLAYGNFCMDYTVNSNAITNRFLGKMLYSGGFISEDLKKEVYDKLKTTNRLGAEFNTSINGMYTYKNIQLLAGIGHRELFYTSFKEDFFKLIFSGNKNFAGEKINIGPMSMSYLSYDKFYLGAQKSFLSDKLNLAGTISYVRGGRYQNLQLKRGTLYTEVDGSYIDMDMDFNLAFATSDNRLIPSAAGTGTALGIQASYKTGKGYLNFEVRDLGFVSWKNINYYSGDSIYRYEGVEVNDILSPDASIFTQIETDTLAASVNIYRNKKTIHTVLPATFHVNYVYSYSNQLSITGGVNYLMVSSYLPRFYVRPAYSVGKGTLIIHPLLAYGGFGKFDLELAASKKIGKGFITTLNLFFMEYLAIPGNSSGHGFNMSLTKLF